MKSLFSIVFLILALSGYGQVSTFSKFYGKDSFNCTNYTVLAVEDSIALLSDYFDGFGTQGKLFRKTDLNGNEAYGKIYGKPDTIIAGHYALCANLTSSNRIILGGQIFRAGAQTAYDILFKLKSNLDTEYVRRIDYAGCSGLVFASELSDKNYLLAGYRQDCVIGANFIATIIKTDTFGNVIWVKEEPHPNHSGFSCTSVVPGGFYVIDQIATDGNTADSLVEIHKYDNDGNLMWKKDFGHAGFNNKTGPLIPTHDGGAVYVLNILDTNQIVGYPTDSMPSVIYRLDSSGNIIWQKWLTYGNFVSLHETRSGAIIFCENLLALPWSGGPLLNMAFSGALFKLGQDGQAVWQQYFKNGIDTSYDNYFWDVTEGADGGIFATGQAVPLHQQKVHTWLVKVDSNGCLNGNCPELYTSIQEESKAPEIFVFPNPAQSHFTVAFGETSDFRRYREPIISITDMTGRVISQTVLTEQATTFSCESFAMGVYFYTIRSDGKPIIDGKLIIK